MTRFIVYNMSYWDVFLNLLFYHLLLFEIVLFYANSVNECDTAQDKRLQTAVRSGNISERR